MAKDFWGKVRGDIQKGYKDSLSFLKSKTGEITEESKKKYKIYEHKHKAHKQIAELGATVYEIVNSNGSVDKNKKVKETVEKIKKLEEQIEKLEAQATKKPTKKKAVTKKKAAARKKTPAKKKTATK
jgi:polyhydroxyalkanoate synthesis regulator phasin